MSEHVPLPEHIPIAGSFQSASGIAGVSASRLQGDRAVARGLEELASAQREIADAIRCAGYFVFLGAILISLACWAIVGGL